MRPSPTSRSSTRSPTEPAPPGAAAGTPPRVPRFAGHHRPGGWETFHGFDGMRVLLGADVDHRRPVVLEGAHGAGRVVLAALHLDKLDGRTEDGATVRRAPAAFVALSRAWFAALNGYVRSVRAGEAPAISAATSPAIPRRTRPPPSRRSSRARGAIGLTWAGILPE